jgi:hypothetical protein
MVLVLGRFQTDGDAGIESKHKEVKQIVGRFQGFLQANQRIPSLEGDCPVG